MHEIIFAPGQSARDEPRAAIGCGITIVGPLRLIELSDHAADRIAQARGEREAEYGEALEKHRAKRRRAADSKCTFGGDLKQVSPRTTKYGNTGRVGGVRIR